MIPDKRAASNERRMNEETRGVALGLEPLGRGPSRHFTRDECETHLRHDIEKAPT